MDRFALVTEFDGSSCLLFHVEHKKGDVWHWSIEQPDSKIGGCSLQGSSREAMVSVQPTDPRYEVVVRAGVEEGVLSQVALHALTSQEVEFELEAREPYSFKNDELTLVTATAVGPAAFRGERMSLSLAAGEKTEVKVTSLVRYPACFGREVGALTIFDSRIRGFNTTPVGFGLVESSAAPIISALAAESFDVVVANTGGRLRSGEVGPLEQAMAAMNSQ